MGVAQPTRVDTAHAGDRVGQRLDEVGGLAVVAEHQHVGVDRVDGLVEQQHGTDVVEGTDDPAVRQDRRRLLRGAALLDPQRIGPLLVEAQRVDAVDDHLAGQLTCQ